MSDAVQNGGEEKVWIVDMGNLHNIEVDDQNSEILDLAQNFGNTLRSQGFAYLRNHGIPEDIVRRAFVESKNFFQLPTTVKTKFGRDIEESFHGYSTPRRQKLRHGELFSELRENFEIIRKHRFWPTVDCPEFQPALETLEKACRSFQSKLLKILGLAIQLEDPEYLCRASSHLEVKGLDNYSHLYTTYYPPIPKVKGQGLQGSPAQIIRCAEHTDRSIFTLLFQDSMGGLEVKGPEVDCDWIPATPIQNTIVVNIGDLLEIWSAGYFKATVHRVVVPQLELKMRQCRQSIAFFALPDDNFVVEPLRSQLLPGLTPLEAGKFGTLTAHQIFEQRAAKFGKRKGTNGF